jgi:hypothetical protein
MFVRNKTYLSQASNLNPKIYIENNDYYNSQLLYAFDQFSYWKYYTVNRFEGRIDLIAEDIYGSSEYYWILLYCNKINNSDIKRGMELRYIPIDQLNQILASI